MTDLFDNPMGLNGFEFVEFASPTPGVLEPVFETLGFTEVARHRSKAVTLFRQGDIETALADAGFSVTVARSYGDAELPPRRAAFVATKS